MITRITLTNDQVHALRDAEVAVVFCDRQGTPLGRFRKLPVTPEQLRVLEQRLDSTGPWQATAEVMARLRSNASREFLA